MQATQKGDPQTPRQPRLTDKTFKLSKQTKRFMTTEVDPEQRSLYKRMMMDAHATAKRHEAEAAKKRTKNKSDEA